MIQVRYGTGSLLYGTGIYGEANPIKRAYSVFTGIFSDMGLTGCIFDFFAVQGRTGFMPGTGYGSGYEVFSTAEVWSQLALAVTRGQSFGCHFSNPIYFRPATFVGQP